MSITLASPGHTSRSPLIYFVDSPEHPLHVRPTSTELASAVATVAVADWADTLTPWPAQGLHHEDPQFGGHAEDTLALLRSVTREFERTHGLFPAARAIAGYSLGGLFSLYAASNSLDFVAAASVSGSLWYDGWTEYVERLDLSSSSLRFAFLSVGTKEKRAAQPRVKRVEEHTIRTAELLAGQGVETRVVVGPGSHFQFVDERISLALRSLDRALRSFENV